MSFEFRVQSFEFVSFYALRGMHLCGAERRNEPLKNLINVDRSFIRQDETLITVDRILIVVDESLIQMDGSLIQMDGSLIAVDEGLVVVDRMFVQVICHSEESATKNPVYLA